MFTARPAALRQQPTAQRVESPVQGLRHWPANTDELDTLETGMMSGSKDDADTAPSNVEVPSKESAHTGQGAPTDEAHQDAGDGSLTGSIPAGLTVDELMKQANSNKPSDGGTG